MKTTQVFLDLAFVGFFISLEAADGQTWTRTSAPGANWISLASSADGMKLAAVSQVPGFTLIYSSTNSGKTWTPTSAPNKFWNTVSSSADGSVLVAANNDSGIWVSTNSGSTWAPGAPFPPPPFGYGYYWKKAACSADGARIVASADASISGPILTSTNRGATWATTNFVTSHLMCLASSADGSKLIAGSDETAPIWTSTNSGKTWTWRQTDLDFRFPSSLACSADGNKIAATAGNGIWVSADSAYTWTSTYAGPGGAQVACSADGMKLLAGGGIILTSTNFGATWVTNYVFTNGVPIYGWNAVASSADGCKLVAAVNDGRGVGGISTSQTTPTPVLNIVPSGSDFLISWIVPSMPFVLQENADLTPTNWTDVTNAPTLNLTNLQHQVVVSPSTSNRFFRLKRL